MSTAPSGLPRKGHHRGALNRTSLPIPHFQLSLLQIPLHFLVCNLPFFRCLASQSGPRVLEKPIAVLVVRLAMGTSISMIEAHYSHLTPRLKADIAGRFGSAHLVASHTMTIQTNTVMAQMPEKALMLGCLPLRFDLTAIRVSAATIAMAT